MLSVRKRRAKKNFRTKYKDKEIYILWEKSKKKLEVKRRRLKSLEELEKELLENKEELRKIL